MRPSVLATILLFAAPAAWADTAAEPQSVEVKGVRNPELKTYRVMLAGMDAFDDDRSAFAPQATELRFRLRQRGGQAIAEGEQLALRISGDETAIAVPISPTHTFSLPRSEAAAREDAELILNKPKGGYRWQPDIHTPGVPAGMRRLGDLRLECRVLIASAKKEIGFMLTATINTLLLSTDWCGHDKMEINTYSPRKLSSATLLHGELRVPLRLGDDNMSYKVPVADKTYANDTLIELQYAGDTAAPAAEPPSAG